MANSRNHGGYNVVSRHSPVNVTSRDAYNCPKKFGTRLSCIVTLTVIFCLKFITNLVRVYLSLDDDLDYRGIIILPQ